MIQQTADISIADLFKSVVSQHPYKDAVKSGEHVYTYLQIDHFSSKVGRYLFERLGETPVPVAIYLENPVNVIAALMGVIRSGHIYCVLSQKNPPGNSHAILNDLDAKILLTDLALLSAAREMAPVGCEVVNIFEIPETHNNDFVRPVAADFCAGVYYTSGSTGEPKGVIYNHNTIISRALEEIKQSALIDEDRLSVSYALSAAASLTIFSALFSGETIFICEIDKQGFWGLKQVLQNEKITVFRISVEPLRHFLASLAPGDFFSDIRCVLSGGDVLYRRDVENLRKHIPTTAIISYRYASSESSLLARNNIRFDTALDSNIIPVGYPIAGKEIILIDENGITVPTGEIGEIAVRSDLRFPGYWRRPDLMDEKFIPDLLDPSRKIYWSGDLGRFRADGQLELIGRKDFRVKIRGFSVDLSAIENLLMSSLDVQRAVVVAAIDPAGQKRLVAYVLPVTGTIPIAKELVNLISITLPTYMVPALLIIVPEMPIGLTGKVDRKSLPTPKWEQITSTQPFMEPGDEIEKKLVFIWKKALRIQQVGVNDNFFDLGGDSLMAMNLLLSIEKEFARKIPLTIISKASTIKQQADILRNDDALDVMPVLIPIQTSGNKKPIYCIGGKGGNPIRFHHLLKYLAEDQPVYFLRARGFDANERVETTIEAIASDYLLEIKRIQQSGPYFFLGESSGGLVAYEMAQQLQRQGQETTFVGMLDTYLSDMKSEKTLSSVNLFMLLKKHAQTLASGGVAGIDMYFRYYIELWKFKASGIRYERIKKKALAQYGDTTNLYKKVEQANMAASRAYKPQPYSGRVVMFSAARQLWLDGNSPDHGWKEVGIGELIVYSLDCYHGNILFEPFVQQVAGKLKQYFGNETS